MVYDYFYQQDRLVIINYLKLEFLSNIFHYKTISDNEFVDKSHIIVGSS